MLINDCPFEVDSVRGSKKGRFDMLFQNRADAGRKLARALMEYKGSHPVVLALPRGGVPVAAEVAAALDAPLDLVLVRKIGVPNQPELAMGAVTDGEQPMVVRNGEIIESCGVSEREFDAVANEELAEIERRRRRYISDRARAEVKGQVAIIIDDGIATGATTLAAIRAVRSRKPKELVLAAPVAPLDTVNKLHSEVDAIVCLYAPEELDAIGYFYSDFHQIGDEEVVATLKLFPANRATHAGSS
jgi:putative phosphoribosyl transferase